MMNTPPAAKNTPRAVLRKSDTPRAALRTRPVLDRNSRTRPSLTLRVPNPCVPKDEHASATWFVRLTRAAQMNEHASATRSVRLPLAASSCSAYSRASVFNQESNIASLGIVHYHFCSKPSIQSLLECSQIPALKSRLNCCFSLLRSPK